MKKGHYTEIYIHPSNRIPSFKSLTGLDFLALWFSLRHSIQFSFWVKAVQFLGLLLYNEEFLGFS